MTAPTVVHRDEHVVVHHGDCLDVLRSLPDASVDAVVTDPPYGLAELRRSTVETALRAWLSGDRDHVPDGRGFMGRRWDGFVPPPAVWDECFRVLKPGGHLLAFAGSRTYDLMGMSIRLAGLTTDLSPEVRDGIAWLYGSGFPKSLDVSKAIDKAAGATREVVGIRGGGFGAGSVTSRAAQSAMGYRPTGDAYPSDAGSSVPITAPATPEAQRWQGWGTALKPAFEPIVVARKPITGTVAANVQAWGTGALNIDGCRVGTTVETWPKSRSYGGDPSEVAFTKTSGGVERAQATGAAPSGRWPANVVLDGSQADALDQQSGVLTSGKMRPTHTTAGRTIYGQDAAGGFTTMETYGDSGGASRFFPTFRYEAKAPTAERPMYWAHTCDCAHEVPMRPGGACLTCGEPGRKVAHPTVKPLDLMRWLVRLVTPPGGTVLEPFAGSGTTAEACVVEGFQCIAIERDADYLPLIAARLTKPIEMVLDLGEVSA